MEVKPGYKQTEVGVIPEDWVVTDLSQFCLLQRGFDITEATRALGDVPVFSSSGISYFHNKAMVSPPGVVTGRKGILGKVFLIMQPFWPHDTTLWVKDFKGNSPAYVALVLEAFHLEKLDAATSVPTLNRNNLAGHLVAIPPTKAEQEAIAGALSDADALIESLEQLVAKKRQIKHGAMQELLTGQKRLPGFEVKPGYKQTEVGMIPEDWSVRYLPVVCRFRGGKAHEQFISDAGSYICVNSKFISTDGSVRKYSSANFCPAKKNDIMMVMSDLPNGRALAKAFIADEDDLYAVNQRVCALTAFTDCPKYLFYILNRNPYFLKFDNGVSQTHLLNNVFRECLLHLPPTVAEQEAIATILSDMDAEIAALETKLAKARQIKQGMMQELLTGRIRLI